MNNTSITKEYSMNVSKIKDLVDSIRLTKESGKVIEVIGMIIKGYLPGASIGSICEIRPLASAHPFFAEIVGFRDKSILMMPFEEVRGVGLGDSIVLSKPCATVRVSDQLLGRVVNGLGEPIDGGAEIEEHQDVPIYSHVRNPLERKPIKMPLDLGIKSINGILTVGEGQRVGIMAGSGVGKSVLLGMMARNTKADVNVIALIGERGRELREFIENDLGSEGMSRSVIVVVTSDQSPLLRMRGAFVATAIAEYFSAIGKKVLLMMDSVTRFAMAQREIGLSTGEPPASKGYTPSVFSTLPKLLERVGSFENEGSITGLYTVLVESDDMDDPVGDAVRSIVDGHFVLSRRLAEKGHFPSIDVLQSASRVARVVTTSEHASLAQKFREYLAIYREAEDLINIGAYKLGNNSRIDRSVKLIEGMNDFLRQEVSEAVGFDQCVQSLRQLMTSD